MAFDCEVMIAGGGPVGLTLGLALSRLGIRCHIAECNPTTTRSPKMDLTNCRSMELFRTLGVADRLRDAAVPRDHNMDVSWVTTMSGHEIHRFAYPSVNEARAAFRARNDGSSPGEPGMRISQIVLEPLLRDIVSEHREVTIRYGCRVELFTQDADGVTTTILNTANGTAQTVRSRWLAACDGGRSTIRQQLGIALNGITGTRPRYMVHFRSHAREVLQRWGIAWHYQSPRFGVMICQDDQEAWTLHAPIPPGADAGSLDPMVPLTAFLGTEIPVQILQANPWVAHLLVAESYRAGRVFLLGDSAHQYIPTGGYGMNTGVGDAFDLAWKLAAVAQGWGGEALLESYDRERRPVGRRNSEASGFHAATKARIAELWPDDLDRPGPQGGILRAETGRRIAEIGNAENESLGIELGYRYDDSPVICAEQGTPPPLGQQRYVPSTWPGTRLPSLYLADGRALHDLLGPGFTLIVFDGAESGVFQAAAAMRRMPLKILALADSHARSVLEREMLLVRPDHHVAWRGNAPPDNVGAVLDRIRGVN